MGKHSYMANYARTHNKYYNKLYQMFDTITDENFSLIPVLTKENLRDSFSIIPEFFNVIDSLQSFRTTGTTGIPLQIFWNKYDYTVSNFHTWHLRKLWYNVYPQDKFCTFHSSVETNGVAQYDDIIVSPDNRIISLGRNFFNDAVLQRYVDALNEFGPTWIMGFSSCIYRLGIFLEQTQQTIPSLRYIELNGEMTDDNMRKEIKNLFRIPVGDLYGSVEFNGIAMRCPSGNMHVLSGNVYVESDNGDLIITSLTNTVMPIIRYSIGDRGLIFDNVECGCKCNAKVLKLTRGRNTKTIRTQCGETLDLSVFNGIIDDIQLEYADVLQYRIDVHGNNMVLVVLIKKDHEKEITHKKNYLLSKLSVFNMSSLSIDIYFTTNEKEFFYDTTSKFQLLNTN